MVDAHPIIGTRMREVRTAKCRSIHSVAFEVGSSCSYIGRVERGEKANPTVGFVWRVAAALEVRPGYLLGIEDARG